jgi:hypothetical protein
MMLPMDKHAVIEVLRAHEPELKAAGSAHLHLHGSIASADLQKQAAACP